MNYSLLNEILYSLPVATLGFEILVFIGSIYFRKHNITFLVLLFLSSRIICIFLANNLAHAYISIFSPIVFAILVSLKKDYLNTKSLLPACLIVILYILLALFIQNFDFINKLHELKFINQTFAYSDFSFALFFFLMIYVVILRKINNFECFLQGAYITAYTHFLFYEYFNSFNLSYFELGSFVFLVAIIYQGYKLAFYDSLTNVYNRRAYDALQLYSGDIIAIIDIDFFKNINDTYGHEVGDIALMNLSKILKKYSKTYRYGGEEFILIFRGKSYDECIKKLENLKNEIENNKFFIKDNVINFTISIGVCMVSNSKFGAFENADNRLYQAKKDGRNKIIFN
ncbi:GGDEF domain-containing protein [Campylobacter sp. MG1]|uniref:GGDEF domain-containing protein n=1 Tax=Campylobacter sp. MG1 TaxID=2976332 RepID=UPI00226D2DA5|nr:GGDEF domain-containing protein [Campylobacter sp. MG1]